MLRNWNQSYAGKRSVYRWATGVLGSAIPTSGDTGAAWMSASLQPPASDTREYRYWIVAHTFPAGAMPPADDGSRTLAGLADGIYAAVCLLYEFDVYAKAFAVTVTVGTPPEAGASQGTVQVAEIMQPVPVVDGITPPHLGEPFTPAY